ncbi:hypothetical protein R5R35_012303 [Gryllus longicercus]
MAALLLLASLAGSLLASAARSPDFCPAGCTCDDETLVGECIDANLDVIPITLNPSIQRLVLKHNRIKTVHAAFQFYGLLQYVDLSYNHLVSIPTRSFEAQRNLVELHLEHNKISAVSNKTFKGLNALTVLNLRQNFLEELPERAFTSLPKLEQLDLGQNRIASVHPEAFAGLSQLRVLQLDDNQLRTVPTPAFKLLDCLAELHVGLNAFATLPDDAFRGLGRLTVLDLSGAGLVNISEHAFRGLDGLRTLKLADNRLRTVPTKQLAPLSRLEELTVGQNEFSALEPHAFQGLTNLRVLDVSGAAQLERVRKGSLADNLNLETLVLSSNKRLASVEEGALAGLPNLRHLVLRDNAFVTFPESMTTWPELRRVDLAENPLECQCGLLWLKDLLVQRNSSQVLCAAPPHLKERPLKSLSGDELGCALHDTRQQAIIGALGGSGLALLAVLGLLLYRYRRRVRDALKDYKWNNRAISRKEHEYQKTFATDDDYIVRAATQQPAPPQHLSAAGQPPHPQGLKPIPVTEL